MTIPNGYNTVPSFRYFEDIAAGVGSIGTTYYVDYNAGADTNDGLSWETPFKKLSVALAASHANIAAGSTGWASRNRIFFKADQVATAEGEDLTKLAQKTDVIGVGSTDMRSMPQLMGNHVIGNTVSYMGCRFINVSFKGPVLVGGDIFTITGQHGISFLGCEFDGSSTTAATAAIIAIACSRLTVKGCVFRGAYSDSVIEVGAGQADDLVIDGNFIQGANVGIEVLNTAEFVAYKYGLITNNHIYAALQCILDSEGKCYVIGNRGASAANSGATTCTATAGLTSDNQFTSANGVLAYPATNFGAQS